MNVPSHRTKLYGRNSVFISAIFTWNYLQNLHRNILFHKLTTKCLKKLLTLHFLRKYLWHDFTHIFFYSYCLIFFYSYCLKYYRIFVLLKMARNFIFAFFSGAWRRFSGDGIGLHKAFFGCHGGVWKWRFLYWLSAGSNIRTED